MLFIILTEKGMSVGLYIYIYNLILTFISSYQSKTVKMKKWLLFLNILVLLLFHLQIKTYSLTTTSGAWKGSKVSYDVKR